MNKTKNKALGSIILLGTIGFLVVSIFRPIPCAATVVWEDNFDGGTYDDWMVQNGTFSAADHTLKPTEEFVWHQANRTSTVAYGTWSFDVYINATEIRFAEYIAVLFMANMLKYVEKSTPLTAYGYVIVIFIDADYETPSISLCAQIGEDGENPIGAPIREYPGGFSGTYHIDVTRDTDGHFYVYVNGVAIIDAVDTTYTTSKYFGFRAMSGHALDNITVNDEITVFPDPSDLKFRDESVSVSCQQNGNATTALYVQNEGEVEGSATLVVGTTPNGITVTLDPDNITNLKLGTSKEVTATIEASSAVSLGNYEVNVELRDGSTVLDTIKLEITVSEASKPPPTEDSPGFLVLGVILVFGIAVVFRRKRNY